ncbi:MAG: hypothetical protein QXS37_04910 [Candidatus Aenigmatarchaeota archaeon]
MKEMLEKNLTKEMYIEGGNLFFKFKNVEELKEFQEKLLRPTLEAAYKNVPYWHRKFKEIGLKPEDIKNVDDLAKAYEKGLKITSDNLVKNFGELLPTWIRNNETSFTVFSSSGTKGFPKMVPYTPDAIERMSKMGLDMKELFSEVGDRVFNQLAPAPFSSGPMLLATVFSKSNRVVFEYVTQQPLPPEFINRLFGLYKFNVILTSPLAAFNIGHILSKENKNSVKRMILSAEPTTEGLRKKIEEMFPSLEEIDTLYASTEYGVNAIGNVKINELAVHPLNLFGVATEDGELVFYEEAEGKDVFTALHYPQTKPGIYFINYSHGDSIKQLGFGETEVCNKRILGVIIRQPTRSDEILNLWGYKVDSRDLDLLPVENFGYVVLFNEREEGGIKKYSFTVRYVPPKEGKKITKEDFLKVITHSNPPAYGFLEGMIKNGLLEIRFEERSPENLYDGIKVSPAKKTRLVRI